MKNAPWNVPEHLAVLDADAERASLGADDDLVLSGEVDERGRGVPGGIVEGAPEQFAVALVKANDGFSISGTALDDKLFAEDKGRRGDSIRRHAGMILDYNIFRPNHFARCSIE